MIINTNESKELIICFNKKVNIYDIPQLCTHGSNINRVTKFKLLGVGIFISSDLHVWRDSHVTYVYATESCKMNVSIIELFI